MTRFYDALWREGLTPEEALRTAQKALRAQLGDRPDPRLWAAWQVSGEPGTHVTGLSSRSASGAAGWVAGAVAIIVAVVAAIAAIWGVIFVFGRRLGS